MTTTDVFPPGWVPAATPERCAILADWLEQRGDRHWAAWFRSGESEKARLETFFGGRGGLVEHTDTVIMGPSPNPTPPNALDGPWFHTLHIVHTADSDAPDLAELAEVPCMTRLHTLVLHSSRIPTDAPTPRPMLKPFRALKGLWWVRDPEVLDILPSLEILGLCSPAGRWAHPSLRSLSIRAHAPVDLHFPQLETLDLHAGTAHPSVLAQVPSVRTITADDHDLPAIARACARGQLPALRTLNVCGDPTGAPANLDVRIRCTHSREWIRMDEPLSGGVALRIRFG